MTPPRASMSSESLKINVSGVLRNPFLERSYTILKKANTAGQQPAHRTKLIDSQMNFTQNFQGVSLKLRQ